MRLNPRRGRRRPAAEGDLERVRDRDANARGGQGGPPGPLGLAIP
jgi:hypothetical protein